MIILSVLMYAFAAYSFYHNMKVDKDLAVNAFIASPLAVIGTICLLLGIFVGI